MLSEDAQRILNALDEKEKEIQEKRRVRMAWRRGTRDGLVRGFGNYIG